MNTPSRVDHDIGGTRFIKTNITNTGSDKCEHDTQAPSFSTFPLQPTFGGGNDTTTPLRSDTKDDETEIPNQSFIRQRNAMYSKRKYYKKKRYIEELKTSSIQLTACNSKLRVNNEQLEALLQRAKDAIAINERSTNASRMPHEDKKRKLQALLMMQQQHQHQADEATLSNATSIALLQLSSMGTMQNHQMIDRLPSVNSSFVPTRNNLTTSGALTAMSRQALQRGMAATPKNHYDSGSTRPDNQSLLSMPSNSITQTTPSSALHNDLSLLLGRDTNSNTQSMINELLLRRELEMSSQLPMTSNINSIAESLYDTTTRTTPSNALNSDLSFLLTRDTNQNPRLMINELLLRRELERSTQLPMTSSTNSIANSLYDLSYTNNLHNGNSLLAKIEAFKSLQNQPTVGRSNIACLQQIVLANEQAQQRAVGAAISGMANATVAARQIRQNQSLDQNSLLRYYLSLTGQNS